MLLKTFQLLKFLLLPGILKTEAKEKHPFNEDVSCEETVPTLDGPARRKLALREYLAKLKSSNFPGGLENESSRRFIE